MKTFYRRNLPHLTPPGGVFFITSVIKGAIPRPILAELENERDQIIADLLKRGNKSSLKKELLKIHWDHFLRVDDFLDKSGPEKDYPLTNPELARIVEEKIKEYDKLFYDLEAYCIIPNHFHMLIDTSIQLKNIPDNVMITDENYTNLSKFMKLIKGGSSFKINRILNKTGPFWQSESYDHLIRSDKEQYDTLCYVVNNPVKAKFVKDWKEFPFTYCKYPNL